MNHNALKLSLIIPTYCRYKELKRLLSNLELQTKKPDEVIIVDASDNGDSRLIQAEVMKRRCFPVYYYKHEKGLTKQRNFGILKSKNEIVGFLDDDVLIEPDFFERILNIFKNDLLNEIGGASGFIMDIQYQNIHLIDEELKSIKSIDEFSYIMQKYTDNITTSFRTSLRNFLSLGKEGKYNRISGKPCHLKTFFDDIKEVDFLRGIAFYRRQVFDKMTYSTFFKDYGFAEDLHFSLMIGKYYKLMVDGKAISYHLHAPSGRPDYFRLGQMVGSNLFYIFNLYEKHSFIGYLLYWYIFYLNALFEVLPAFWGQNSLIRIKMFIGQIHGSFSSINKILKK